LVDMN